MCGILGSINVPFDHQTLDLLAHRGPNDYGIQNYNITENEVLLAHRRLSIQDLSEAGHQPMVSKCGKYVLVFNGEIYNHWDLRVKLQHKDFKGTSDTETILYYLKEFGIRSVVEFNGIFSLSFLDLNQHKLFLVRDAFGVKPLYYHIDRNRLFFSSEIRAITRICKTDLDLNALSNLLLFRYNPAPNTLHKGVQKLHCGHIMEVSFFHKSFVQKIYPFTEEEKTNYFIGSFADASHQYENLIEKAVQRQLLSDVEVGIFLSGGIDSSIVASIAQKYSSYPLKAFTVGFDHRYEENEIEDARKTAEYLGLDFYEKRISVEDFLGLIKECTRIVEEPLATTSIIPMYYLSKMASQQVHVVLSGQGADEPLGGYQKYQGELYRDLLPEIILNNLPSIAKLFNVKKEYLLRAASSLPIPNDVQRFLKVYATFNLDEIVKLIGIKEPFAESQVNYFYELLACSSLQHPVERMMKIDARMNLADDLLNYTDKISMNFTLETRVPMLDTELIKFIESLPIGFRLKLNKTKIIHRDYSKKILPKFIINRPKKGFKSPTSAWFRDEYKRISFLLLNTDSPFSNYFDLKEVEKIIHQHQIGYNKEKQLFLLLSIYYFLELNNY